MIGIHSDLRTLLAVHRLAFTRRRNLSSDMRNKLIKVIAIALAAIALVAIFAFVGMGVMMFWLMDT